MTVEIPAATESSCSIGHSPARNTAPVIWRLGTTATPLAETLPVTEAVHIAVLSLAGRRFGANAIPPVFSGRGMDGSPLRGREQHRHKHVLVGSDDGLTIGLIALWAPMGLTGQEREVVARLHLRHRRGHIPLEPTDTHPAFATAQTWRTLTPYLPFNHLKPSGRNSIEGQIRRELVEFRGMPNPESIRCIPQSVGSYVLQRGKGHKRGEPPPCPYDLQITFADPVTGPIALGRHAHFSLGVLVPVRSRTLTRVPGEDQCLKPERFR